MMHICLLLFHTMVTNMKHQRYLDIYNINKVLDIDVSKEVLDHCHGFFRTKFPSVSFTVVVGSGGSQYCNCNWYESECIHS